MAELSTSTIDFRSHLPVMSECDSGCRLCSLLGCLRPARLTFPEFLAELDLVQLGGANAIVFPPNFLNHVECIDFCAEVIARGLRAIVRLRPSQLSVSRELISGLEYRGAEFEVIVNEPLPLSALTPRIDFTTVFVGSDALLFDSLPFTWRSRLEFLAGDATPDEMFLIARAPYSDFFRKIRGWIPGERARTLSSTTSNDVRLSVIVQEPVSWSTFADQSLDPALFEVIVVGRELAVEPAPAALKVQILKLPRIWGVENERLSEVFNLGATHARGGTLLFVEPGFPIERSLLERCLLREGVCELHAGSRALLMPTRSYFDMAGFSTRAVFELALWKFARIGTVVDRWRLDSHGNSVTLTKAGAESSTTPPIATSAAAIDLYLTTFDRDIYSQNYVRLGPHLRLRKIIWRLTRSTALARFLSLARRSTFRLQRAVSAT